VALEILSVWHISGKRVVLIIRVFETCSLLLKYLKTSA
jgi:hypothetical protein